MVEIAFYEKKVAFSELMADVTDCRKYKLND